MAEAVPPHEAAFATQFEYMVDSIDAGAVAPACLAAGLINDRQREECFRESSSFKKAELLLGYVKRSITGDGTKFDTFVAILRRTGHIRQADILNGSSSDSPTIPSHSKRSHQHPRSTSISPPPSRRSRSQVDESLNVLLSPSPSPPTITQSASSPPPTRCSRLGNSYSALIPPSSSPPATTSSAVTGSSSAQVHQHSLSPYLQQYVQHLKNRYISIDTPVYDKEQGLLQTKVKSFINIALVHKDSPKYMIDSDKNEMLMDRLHGYVDAIQKKKTKLHMCQVCKSQHGKLARCVLVEGAPGVGKTTFAFELCKRWARGEILQEWPVVAIIKLRDYRTRTAQNMYDLLYHPDPEVRQAVVKKLVQQDGKGMMLLLDGYDELTDSQREFNSVIQCLMSRELLCQSTLMVTSRPLATRKLHDSFVHSIDQHIEVLGFTEKNIEEYIQSACGDKPELVDDFKSYLSCHPFSSALMFNPLQCAIVTDLYRNHWEIGDKGFAPKTLTELYTGLVHILLLRYLTQHPVYNHKDWKIKDLKSDLPEEVSQQLTVVTKLAAKGIENQQYVFDDVDGNVPSETLGLMQREEDVTAGMGRSASHSFLHLTLQEYLTAVNYCTHKQLPISKLLEQNGLFPVKSFLDTYGKKRKHTLSSSATHWPVVLFLAGRTKLSDTSPDTLKKGLHNLKRSSDVTEVNMSLLHLLYETQSPQLIQSTLVTSRKYLSISGHSALDWFVIGYCIANSMGLWKLEKKAGDKHNYLDRLILGLSYLALEETKGKGKIHSLIINGYCPATVQSLSQIQTCYTESMTELKLLNPKSERTIFEPANCVIVLDVSTHCPNLEVLEIEGVVTISSLNKLTNLNTLSLSGCNLSIDASRSDIFSRQSPHCKLRYLRLSWCVISTPDQSLLATINKATLESLDTFGPLSVLDQLIPTIHPFTQLTDLKLHFIIVDSSSSEILENIHSCCLVLESLTVWCDEYFSLPFSIARFIFSQQNNLHTLSLRRCILNSDLTVALIDFVQSLHYRLNKLTLDKCTIQQHSFSIAICDCHLESTSTGKVSMNIKGSCSGINYMLSQPLFHVRILTALKVTVIKSENSDSLQILFDPKLETLDIALEMDVSLCHSIFYLSSRKNNLCSLSLRKCNLISIHIRSLINFLQSPNCRLQKLTLDKCTTPTSEEIQQTMSATEDNGTLHSLDITDSLCVVDQIMSHVIFTQLTELIYRMNQQYSMETEVFQKIICFSCPALNTVKCSYSLPLSIPQLLGSQKNNLHTLSLLSCTLNNDVTRSLISSMQSLHCRLQNLALNYCTISLPEDTQQTTILTKINVALHSLDISWSVLSQMMTYINPFTQSLTELILHVDDDTHTCTSRVETIHQKIPFNCPLLETLKIKCNFLTKFSLPLSIPQFIGSQQNNLHTFLLSRCTLNSDVTRSLIHSLQQPLHCRICKLALYDCTIPTTDHTQLITAIVCSTTITHLLFSDKNIDTPSLKALVSGLKHNTTIEQLAFDKLCNNNFTKDQFQVLIDAVDSSAVKKLWLRNSFSNHHKWFGDCTFSRKNVDIEWCDPYYDLYNKW